MWGGGGRSFTEKRPNEGVNVTCNASARTKNIASNKDHWSVCVFVIRICTTKENSLPRILIVCSGTNNSRKFAHSSRAWLANIWHANDNLSSQQRENAKIQCHLRPISIIVGTVFCHLHVRKITRIGMPVTTALKEFT